MERDWFKCSTCSRLFATELQLQTHNRKACQKLAPLRDNTKKQNFQCDMCPRRFSENCHLSNHCNKAHQETVSKIWKLCRECNNFFPPKSFNAHTRSVHSQEDVLCQFCAELIRRNCYYSHVNRLHFNEVEDTWMKCQECKWLLPTEKELSNHQKRDSCRVFKCQVCNAKFKANKHRKAHIKQQHPEEALLMLQTCNKCLSPIFSADELHICLTPWSKTNTPHRRCKFCDQEMTSMRSYFKHANEDHKEIIKDDWRSCPDCLKYYPDLKLDRCKKTSKDLKCDFCDKVWKDSYSLHQHANRRHKFWLKKSSWVKCLLCPKYFVNQLHQKRHTAIHDRFKANGEARNPTVANGSSHEQLPDNQSHLVPQDESSVNVPANRLLACEFCSKRISRKYYAEHANKYHPREIWGAWHSCKACNLYLDTKQSLISHIIDRHTAKPVKIKNETHRCDFCRLAQQSYSSLSNHVHNCHRRQVEKHWHCCQQCKKFFPSKQSLLVHQRKMHLDFCGSMVTTCNICNSEFPTFESFCIHANKNHLELLKEKTDWLFCKKCLLFWPVQKMTEHQTDCLKNCRMKSTCVHCEEDIDSSGHHFNTKHRDKVASAWYNCSDCQWYFFTEEQLLQHCKLAHLLKEDQSSDSSVSEYVSCSFCPELFLRTNELNFYQHCNTVHEDKVKSEWLECQDCDARRPDHRELAYHQVKVHLNSRTSQPDLLKHE